MADGGLEPHSPEILVTREPPFVIRAATLAWVRAVGYSEQEIIGRSASVLQGEGTCVVTLGALWTALEARALPTATMSLYSSLTGLRSERKTPPKALYTNRKAQKKRASCMKLFLQWVCLSRAPSWRLPPQSAFLPLA